MAKLFSLAVDHPIHPASGLFYMLAIVFLAQDIQAHFVNCLPQTWNHPFLQGSLLSFNG